MRADLHCHSRYSDGSASVEDLICMAKQNGLAALALTDHDTFAGIHEAKQFAKQYAIEFVPGIELSGYDTKRQDKAHILCYYPQHPEALDPICQTVHQNRETATRKMLRKVIELYPTITEAMVDRRAADSTSIYKQHILHTLIDAGYSREFFGELYQTLFSHQNGLAHLEIEYPDVYDVLQAARASGSVIVVAHPGESKQPGLVEELAAQGWIDGVEYACPKNDAAMQKQLAALAAQYHLILTGGTDFHGMYSGRNHPIGSFTTSWDSFQQLKALAAKKQKEG